MFPVDKQARLDHTTACFLSACSACVTTTGIDVRGRHEHVTRIEWKIQFRRGTARSRHAPANFLPTARRREENVIRPAGTITTRVPDRRKTRKWETVARFLSRRSVDSTHLCHFLRHRLLPEESKLKKSDVGIRLGDYYQSAGLQADVQEGGGPRIAGQQTQT